MKSVYQEGLDVIDKLPGTGTAGGMAMLIASLYNSGNAFSISDCIANFSPELVDLALRMIKTYAHRGESDELRRVGFEVLRRYPSLDGGRSIQRWPSANADN